MEGISSGRNVAASGRWVGNRTAGTSVVDARNGAHLDSSTAVIRFVIRHLVSPIFLAGFLMALGNSQRRTFHDVVAGSVVTRPKRESWSIDDEPGAGNGAPGTDVPPATGAP